MLRSMRHGIAFVGWNAWHEGKTMAETRTGQIWAFAVNS